MPHKLKRIKARNHKLAIKCSAAHMHNSAHTYTICRFKFFTRNIDCLCLGVL